MTLSFYDAAYPPPSTREPRTDGVAFYIGGDTPHVWTVAEIGRQPARYRLPIWVRSNPGQADPSADGNSALQRLAEIVAPKACLIALDLETAVNPAYVAAFKRAVTAGGGHPVITYGSRSTVYRNAAGLYWDADWDRQPHISPNSMMTQYENNPAYDLSQAATGLPFWDARPHAPGWPIGVMLRPGDRGPAVRVLQQALHDSGLRGVRGIAVDGIFGPQTETAVRNFQAARGLAVDGIAGPATRAALGVR